MDRLRRIFVRDELGLWFVTVVIALSPISLAAVVLYVRANDSEAWWQKFPDVFQDGELLLVTATVLATAIGNAKSAIFDSLTGRLAMGASVTMVLIAAGLWGLTRFEFEPVAVRVQADETTVANAEGPSESETATTTDPEQQSSDRIVEVSLYLFISSMVLGSAVVWLSSTEESARELDARLIAQQFIDLTQDGGNEHDESKVNEDQTTEG